MNPAGRVPPTPASAPARGFTLIEFLVTLVIAGILATLAAPSFVQYIAAARIRNASYDLTSALHIARSEAIKRNTAIDVVRTTSSGWAGGWKVQLPGATPTVLRQQDGYQALTITPSPGLTTVSYGNDGRATTAATTFKIEPSTSISAVTARCVTISLSGIPSSKAGGC